MGIVKAEGIKIDSIINVEISGGYYARLHQLLQSMMASVTPEQFSKALESIKAGSPTDPFAYHLETILTLINGVEAAAKEQGLISIADIEIKE